MKRTGRNRDELIVENLPLTFFIANRYHARYGHACRISPEDMAGEGCLGLIKAATAYDPSIRRLFGPYASLCISSSIRDAIKVHGRQTRRLVYTDKIDLYHGSPEPELAEALDRSHRCIVARSAIETLTREERRLIHAHLGLDRRRPRTFTEMSQDRPYTYQTCFVKYHAAIDKVRQMVGLTA